MLPRRGHATRANCAVSCDTSNDAAWSEPATIIQHTYFAKVSLYDLTIDLVGLVCLRDISWFSGFVPYALHGGGGGHLNT